MNKRLRRIKNAKFFLNVITSLSLLKPPWFILVSLLVIFLEALVFHYYWKNWRRAIEVSAYANICSTLIAGLCLMTPIGGGSLWILLIGAASNINEYEISEYNTIRIIFYVWPIIFFSSIFMIAFILSTFMEIHIGKVLQVQEERRRTIFFIANLVTYSIIIVTLIDLGIWTGITNQGPFVDNWDFFEKYFVQRVPFDPPLDFFLLLTLLIGIVLEIFLLVWKSHRSSNKSISQPLE